MNYCCHSPVWTYRSFVDIFNAFCGLPVHDQYMKACKPPRAQPSPSFNTGLVQSLLLAQALWDWNLVVLCIVFLPNHHMDLIKCVLQA